MSRKKAPQRPIAAYCILIAVLGVSFVVIKWSWGQYQTAQRAGVLLDEVATKQEKVSARLETLESRNRLLETETGREDILIDRFAVKKPGERVLILVEEDEEGVVVKPIVEAEPTFWERLTSW